MARPFLIAYDGSAASKAALSMAAERAQALGRPVLLVTVVPEALRQAAFTEILLPGIDVPRLAKNDTFVETARKNLEAVAAEYTKRGVRVEPAVRTGDPADEILAAAQDADAEQLFVGFKSYEKRLPYGLGSTADKILRYSDRTVTIVRTPA